MISRSDGKLFHLLLADRALPYPNERSSGPTRKISLCFWYSHTSQPHTTNSAIVILPSTHTNRPSVFRSIEVVADLLAEEFALRGHLDDFYDLTDVSFFALAS